MKTGLKKEGRIYTKTYFNPATGVEDSSKKSIMRYKIQKEVIPGEEYDIFDIAADMQKRINILEQAVASLLAKKNIPSWNTLLKETASPATKGTTALYKKLKKREITIKKIINPTSS